VYARKFGSLREAVGHPDGGLAEDRVSANASTLSFAVAAGMVLGALLARE
jgi:hypothetical protein